MNASFNRTLAGSVSLGKTKQLIQALSVAIDTAARSKRLVASQSSVELSDLDVELIDLIVVTVTTSIEEWTSRAA